MRKYLFVFVLLLIGIGLFIFALKTTDLSQVTFALLKLWPTKFLLVLFIYFSGAILISSFRWFFILKTEKQKPKFSRVLWAKTVGHSLSYLTPVVFLGGEPFRYIILKEENSIDSNSIISSIIIDKLIFFVVSAISFLIGLFFFLNYIHVAFKIKFFIFAALIIGLALAELIYFKVQKLIEKRGIFTWLIEKLYLSKIKTIKENQKKIEEIEKEIFNFFKVKRKATTITLVLATIEIFFLLFSYWLIIHFIGKGLELGKIFAINGMIGLAYIIPLPAALGSLEVSQAFIFDTFELYSGSGIAFSLILRGISLIIAGIGISLLVWFQIRLFKKRIIQFFQGFYEK
jgi:uncharacterized protein (TIRG00374 family)